MTDCPDSSELLAITREKLLRCKCICLDELGFNFYINPASLSKYDKDRLLEKVKEYMDKPDEEVNSKFNSLVCGKWLGCGTDISAYPVYDVAGNRLQ